MQHDEITPLDAAVSLFSKQSTLTETGHTCQASFRIPALEFAKVDAIANYSGQSRNRVVVELLRVGLDSVLTNMPEEEAREIYEIFRRLMGELVEDGNWSDPEEMA